MTSTDIISTVVTFIGVFSFATLFTILYKSYASSQIAEIKSGKRDIEIIDEVIYDRQSHVQQRRKVIGLIRTIAFYLVIIIIIPIFAFSLVNKVMGNVMMIGDKAVMVVATGSMSYKNEANSYLFNRNLNNQFQQYDIIVLERVDKSDIRMYDVIAYKNDKDMNIIHRIIDIDGSKYVTRGDIYDSSKTDLYKPSYDDVIGRYTGKRIPSLGIFIMFLQSYAGIITVVSLVYCLLMIDRTAERINKVQQERIDKLEEALDYLDESSSDCMKAEYKETIYYKGYAYMFDENGFIDKTEITEGPYLEKSNDTIIKETEDLENNKTTEEVVIDNQD